MFFFTFSDSYIFAVRTPDITEALKRLSPHFDFSNYDVESELFNDEHKAALGRWKNECPGRRILSAVGMS